MLRPLTLGHGCSDPSLPDGLSMLHSAHRLLVLRRCILRGPSLRVARSLTAVQGRGSRLSTCTQRADMHGSSEAVTLAARTPAQATPPPRGHRGSRRESWQVDRQAPATPRNPAPSRRGGRGPAEDPGLHSHPPRPILLSLCGPDGARVPRGDHPAGVTTGFDRLSQRLHPNQQRLR